MTINNSYKLDILGKGRFLLSAISLASLPRMFTENAWFHTKKLHNRVRQKMIQTLTVINSVTTAAFSYVNEVSGH